jgi:N-methylhydantoinase B
VAELCARRGRDRVAAAMDELLAYSERVVRAAIRELPDGRFEGATSLETRAGPFDIRAAVTIDGDSIDIDFAGTAPQYDGTSTARLA